mmetsp:Transcript_22157/g.48179  ORF Transcript_22157/g.48179 Transcript_22157/m.48179 type:complete len:256 (-) Transcript_22157:95-862(-)
MRINTLILAIVAIANRSTAQDYDYQDFGDGYEQDNLYEDYAMKQQDKGDGGKGGFGFGQVAVASAASYILGAKIHSGRVAKTMKKKHSQDQKTLYTQYYNDVYKLEEQKAEQQLVIDQLQKSLHSSNEEHEMENLQREYDEFKQPDVDGDDQISRTEFNLYVKNYLANYPGLTEKDYPKFEDFDHDKDGFVSFTEYAQQMGVQAQQAEMDQYYAESQGKSGQKEAQKANALYDLYGSASTKGTDGFNDLYAQIRR